MIPLRQETRRKRELLARYRERRREELLEAFRAQAAREAERDRYPWKGEFRTREEILELYRLRRRWDRRFLTDMFLVVVVLAGAVLAGPQAVNLFLPGGRAAPPAQGTATNPAPAPSPGGSPETDPGR